MSEWKEGTPLDYFDEVRKIGRVYVGVSKGPPLMVREFDAQTDDPERMCLVIEFEDITELVRREYGFPKKDDEQPVLRAVLQLPGARKLCHNLITCLADSGDRVANRIQFMMRQAIDSLPIDDEI